MSEERLKPCPFCGDTDMGMCVSDNDLPAIQCNNCGAYGPCISPNDNGARLQWNTRSALEQQAGEWATAAARDVIAERRRQVEKEGWTPEHDDEHSAGEMAKAASAYALWASLPAYLRAAHPKGEPPSPIWPWSAKWWKPRDPRRDLVRAAALILAEIERIDRASAPSIERDR